MSAGPTGRGAAGVVLALALALAAGASAAQEESVEQGERIGRYRVARTPEGLAIGLPRGSRVGAGLAVGGLLLAGVGLLAGASGRPGTAVLVVAIGVGLAAVGASALVGDTRWVASETGLVRVRSAGGETRWGREAIGWVAVRRAPRSSRDLRDVRGRPWQVRVHAPSGEALPTRFELRSEREARALARALAGALGVGVREAGAGGD